MPAKHLAAVAAAAVAITLLWLEPLVAHLSSAVLSGPSDVTSTIRQFESGERLGHSPFTFSHDPLLGAPEGTTFSRAVQVANAIQPAFVWTLKQGVGWIAAFNVFLLLGFILTALATFVLLHRLGVHPAAAAFGAYVFSFNPYAFEKAGLGQPGLLHNWVLVVLLIALLGLHERRTVRQGVLVGLTAALCFYMHTYLGFVALLAIAVVLAVDLIDRRGGRRLAIVAGAGVVALGVALTPAIAVTLDDRTAARQVTSERAEVLRDFGAVPSTYLKPPGGSLVGAALSSQSRDERIEDAGGTMYFGYVTLLLAVFGVVLLVRRQTRLAEGPRRFAGFAGVALVVVAFLVALPDRVTLLGLDLPMPSWLLGNFTPGIRVYSRFGILVGLGLVVLAALALDVVARRRHGKAFVAAALALVAVELAVGPPIQTWDTDEPPAYDRWLATQDRGIVAIYPPPGEHIEEENHTRGELFFQTVHWQPLFFTESPRKSRGWAIRELSGNLDEPGVPQLLASQGVRYVVVNDDVYRAIGDRPPNVPLPLLRRFDGARAFRVVAEPADVETVLHASAGRVAEAMGIPAPTVEIPGKGFQEPERSELDGRDWRWLIEGGVLEIDVPEASLQFELKGIAFSAHRNRLLILRDEDGSTLGKVDVGTATRDFTISPFRLPKGKSRLLLDVSPPPEQLGESDQRFASIFLSPVVIRPLADYSRR